MAEVLWGEDLPATWEPSLRSFVSRVRRRLETAGLPGEVITGGRGFYQLHLPEVGVIDVEKAVADVETAKEALTRGDWARAREWAGAAADAAGARSEPGWLACGWSAARLSWTSYG